MSQSKWMEGPFSDRAPLKVTATRRKTVVLVCMVDSIHVARWIAQFDPTEVKFILFPSGPNRRVHPKIVEMIERGKEFDNQMTLVPFGGKLSLPLWALDRFFSDRIRGLLLRRTLKKIQPDFVHALEFQHAGYVTIRALRDKNLRTPFIATNYGSDIFWFQKFPGHRRRIERILIRANYYSCECPRDVKLARLFGFSGQVLSVFPNSGPIEATNRQEQLECSSRKIIMVKGYHGWAGRSGVAILALAKLRLTLTDLSIIVYSSDLIPRVYVLILRLFLRMDIRATPKGKMRHSEILAFFDQTRMHIGLSRTDGLSTSTIEAMSRGAFPIQTASACVSELIREGVNGCVIQKLDVDSVASSIRKYLHDAQILDSSQLVNEEKIGKMFGPLAGSLAVSKFYR